jgi:hypothetical protein
MEKARFRISGRRGKEPFVGVEDERIGEFRAIENVSEFRDDGGGTGVGGVDVEPESALAGAFGDAAYRIDAGGGSGANRGDDAEGQMAGFEVTADGVFEIADAHAELRVGGDFAYILLAETQRDGGLLDGGMGVLGLIKHEGFLGTAGGAYFGGGEFTRGGEGMQAGGGGGIEDDSEVVIGKTDPLTKPVEDDYFEFRDGRGGFPKDAVGVERGGEELGKDSRSGRRGGEVSEEAGVIPVGDGGEDNIFEVGEGQIEGFGLLGPGGGESVHELTRGGTGEDRILLGVLQVGGNPVDELMAEAIELAGR